MYIEVWVNVAGVDISLRLKVGFTQCARSDGGSRGFVGLLRQQQSLEIGAGERERERERKMMATGEERRGSVTDGNAKKKKPWPWRLGGERGSVGCQRFHGKQTNKERNFLFF